MDVSASLEHLNSYLADHSYLGDAGAATLIDYEKCAHLEATDLKQFPHLRRWHQHISHLVSRYGRSNDCRGSLVLKGAMPQSMQGRDKALLPKQSNVAVQSVQSKQGRDEALLPKQSNVAEPSFFCVLDFEKTCQNREIDANFSPQEIIEFPSVLLARGAEKSVVEFESFVKPTVHPVLTAFCTELTGITQQQVDSAKRLPEVLVEHHVWLRSAVPAEGNCIFVTCGDMDLKRSLPEDPNLPQCVPACYRKWINIKKEFGVFYSQWYKKGKQPRNMVEMLEKLGLALDGQHHSGIDDCRNIAKVVQKMLADGWTPRV